MIAVGGVLSRAHSLAARHEFGGDRRTWRARLLDLAQGLPSEATFRRGRARRDPGAFQKGLWGRMQAGPEITANQWVASDGQTRRGSSHPRDGKAALPRVGAWATENQLALGQVGGDAKSNQIPTLPELLGLLDLSAALVTIDAMGGQKESATPLRQGGGDSVLAVKPNPPTLEERVTEAVGEGLEPEAAWSDEPRTVEKGPGPQETRTSASFPACAAVDPARPGQDRWGVGVTFWERVDSRGRTSLEGRYYLRSRPRAAAAFAEAVRGHWRIENHLPWPLAVSFREEDGRVRTGPAAANLSVIRRFALGLLRRETGGQRGIATQRLKGGLSEEYREKVLLNT